MTLAKRLTVRSGRAGAQAALKPAALAHCAVDADAAGGEELTGRALRYRGRGRGLYAAVERRGGRRRRRDNDSFSDEFDDSEEEVERVELPKRGRVCHRLTNQLMDEAPHATLNSA